MELLVMLGIFLVAFILGAFVAKKEKTKEVDGDLDIEKNDRKWKINEERIKKLRAEITQALKEKGKYTFKSKTDKGYEGIYLNDGELYELLRPFLRKGYFVKKSTDRFTLLNEYFKISKHRGSYSDLWGVTEEDLEHQL